MKQMYVWRDSEIECDEEDRVLNYEGNRGAVNHVAISHSGRFVSSSDSECVVRHWDGISGKQLKVFVANHDWITFAADGQSFFDRDGQDKIIRRSISDGSILRKYSGYGELLFISRQTSLGVSERDGSFLVWNYETGTINGAIKFGERSEYFFPRFALSSKGGFLLAKIQSQPVKLWHVPSASIMYQPKDEHCDCDILAEPVITPDGRSFLYSCYDNEDFGLLIARDIETGKIIYSERKPDQYEYSLDIAIACSRTGKLVAVADNDNFIRVKHYLKPEISYCFLGHGDEISSLFFSNKGKFLYSASLDGSISKWKMPFSECNRSRAIFCP